MRFGEHVCILHVEDDPIDARSLQRGLRRIGVQNRVVVARNGEEALDLLENDPALRADSLIVVADINMPRMTGVEFLARVRETPALRGLVVYVLTSSDQECDIEAAYRHNVAGYIVKPHVSEELHEVVRRLHELWQISEFEPGPVRRRAS